MFSFQEIIHDFMMLPLATFFSPGWQMLAEGVGGNSNLVGGSGQLVAAALQTAGVYAQARVLDDFRQAFDHLAGLCFLVSIIGAIFSTAMFGSYRKAAYFLIGPPLFYWAINTRSGTDGAHLRYADREIQGSVQQQIRFLKEWVHNEDYSQPAQVSSLFLVWDALVSSIVEGITSQLIDARAKEDLMLRTRERVFSYVLHTLPDEGAFVKLLAYGAHGRCAHAITQVISAHSERPPETPNAPLSPAGRRMIQEYERLADEHVEIDEQSYLLISQHPSLQGQNVARNPTCRQVWRWTSMLAHEIASNRLSREGIQNGAGLDENLPWDQIIRETRLAFEGGPAAGDTRNSRTRAEDVLAAYIVRNTLQNVPLTSMTQEMFSRQPFNPTQQRFVLDSMQNPETYGAYMKVLYVAGAIPYLQGMLLFMLAMVFPFFAMFLVMPSRASSFLIWLSLWAWVKSWDVGYAMVDVARRVLWQFLAHGTNRFGEQVNWDRPETVYNLMAMNDPLATHNMYLQMIAFLTCSIPFLTAHFCLGASNLLDFVKLTVDNNANKFADSRMRGVRRGVGSEIEKLRDEREQLAFHTGGMAAVANRGFNQLMGLMGARPPAGSGGAGPNLGRVGENARNGQQPTLGGDYSIQELYRQGGNQAVSNYRHSDEFQGLSTALGVTAGRLSYFNYGQGYDQLGSYTDHINLSYFIGSGPGERNRITGSPRSPITGRTGAGGVNQVAPTQGE